MRIGTRGSALALAQTRLVAQALGGESELVVVKVAGDDPGGEGTAPSAAGGDKSRWVSELERALLADEIDLAVHSAKDVPGELADGLELLGAPPRATATDALIGATDLDELAAGARVGTSSLRRRAQLLAVRTDLEVVGLRGNVDTRLRKLADGELDAIVLAGAGLERLDRADEIGAQLDIERFVPAPGQGTLALQARSGDEAVSEWVAPILDADTGACLRAERAVAAGLDADCDTPLGAYAVPAGCGCLHLRAWVGLPDGSAWLLDELIGGFYEPRELGARMAERMLQAGAGELLARAREMALERA
jgi:hydroxymethylbilane synthase